MEKCRLSKYVAEKRKLVGLSQKELAELLFYTPQALSRFEALDSAFPLSQADALCKALDCSLDDIYLRNLDDTHYRPLPFDVEELGGLLSECRKRKEISQEDMASSCDVSARSLRNYESGKGSISLQFLDSFCTKVGLLPSELAIKVEEPQAVVQPPAPKRRLWIPIASLSSLVAVVVALVLTFILLPKNNPVSPGGNPNESTVSQAQSSSGKYGLPIEEGLPNFLTIECDRHAFNSIGDVIVITLVDPYDQNPILLLSDNNFIVTPSNEYSADFAIDYAMIQQNQVAISLKSARNGEGTNLNIYVGNDWYYSLGYFYYRTAQPAYIPGDTNHEYPINGGKVLCNDKSKVEIMPTVSQTVNFEATATNGDTVVNFDEEHKPIYRFTAGALETTRIDSHDYPCTIDGNQIHIPTKIEIDNVLVLGWVKVEDNQGEYWYFLDPLVINLAK